MGQVKDDSARARVDTQDPSQQGTISAADIVALDRGLPGKILDLVADRAARCRSLIEPAPSGPEVAA